MTRYLRWVLLPIIVPVALVWVFAGIFLLLGPCLFIAFSLLAIGETDAGERIMDWATEMLFFERRPWTWLRGQR